MHACIDVRERDVLDCLRTEYSELALQVKQLQLGDFVFSKGNKTIIAERKTVKDLCASIIDGRYREQRSRLCTARSNGCSILYIIEGSRDGASGVPYSTALSSMLSCALRYNIPVIRTSDIRETCFIIAKIYGDVDSYCTSISNPEYVPQGKVHAPSSAAALSCAPRVSVTLAQRILAVHGTIDNIVAAFKSDGNHALCKIEKVGKKTSEGIYNMLMA